MRVIGQQFGFETEVARYLFPGSERIDQQDGAGWPIFMGELDFQQAPLLCGKVTSASSGTTVMGKTAALADDTTFCPKCKGSFPITPDGAGAKHMGKPYAYDGDTTACGAHLITSL